MCLFVYVALPAGADLGRAGDIAARLGFELGPAGKGQEADSLAPGERLLRATGGHCDCGSELGRRSSSPDVQAARRRAEGWSEAKIGRWLAQIGKAAEPEGQDRGGSHRAAGPTAEAWLRLAIALVTSGATPYLGLVCHLDRGLRHPLELRGRRLLPLPGLSADSLRGLPREWLHELR